MVYIPPVAVLAHKIIQDSKRRSEEPQQEILPAIEHITFEGYFLTEGKEYLYYSHNEALPIKVRLLEFKRTYSSKI